MVIVVFSGYLCKVIEDYKKNASISNLYIAQSVLIIIMCRSTHAYHNLTHVLDMK